MHSQCLVTQSNRQATHVTALLLCIAFAIDAEGRLQNDRLVIVGDLQIS